jgi:tRNA 2-thiouridine synthesizing protein A
MTDYTLDITGKVCPYCILAVQKEVKKLKKGDRLSITLDHPPAATETIPRFARDGGFGIVSMKLAPGLWKIELTMN